MRVATQHRVLQAEPGEVVEVVVDVVNTGDLIDGVTARVIGLPGAAVVVEPRLLPLFPDASGQLTVSVTLPTTQPAGTHPVTVEVVSHGAGVPSRHVDLDLSVSARPAVRLARTPEVVRARRGARFLLDVENTGNVTLDASLGALVEDSRTTSRFNPATVRVEPGTSAPVLLVVRGPRMLTGNEAERVVQVGLTGRRAYSIPAMDEADNGPDVTAETTVRLRQRPLLSRGLLTALVLLTIIALWAGVFLLGLTQVLSGDPVTKTAPASFFPAAATAGAGGDTVGGAGAGGTTAAPPGSMPKTGLLAPGVGSEVSGTVSATSNQLPVGRILVQAFRDGRDGPVLVSQAASQADGTYALGGLFPTAYRIKFSAEGFEPVWFPDAGGRTGAQPVEVVAQGAVEGVDAVITGQPAQISGSVDPGSALEPFTTEVVARPVGGAQALAAPGGSAEGAAPVAARTTTAPDGSYTLAGLPAPATYELSFTSPGYAATKVVTTVNGGETRLQPSVVMGAGAGQISGTVRAAGSGRGEAAPTPLGNVTVTTESGGQPVSVTTPTVGAVGTFVLGDLPTPGTYVLTFSGEGIGTTTEIVDLAAGESSPALDIRVPAGTGTVSGVVTGADGEGLGGVEVYVGGATGTAGTTDTQTATTGATGTTGAPGTATGSSTGTGAGAGTGATPAATTLTNGARGSFTVNGLSAPGSYTLTFVKDGLASETVPVTLSADAGAPVVRVTLRSRLGSVSGTVRGPAGNRFDGASVTATNGTQTFTTISSAPGTTLPRGGFLLTNLPPGTYSVTVSSSGLRQQTALVVVSEGQRATQDLQLSEVG